MAGAAILPRPRKRPRRCKHAPLSLPLDLLSEVAARSDPVTLVRCATTCKELRRHAQRFVVPSLLRGGLVDRRDGNLMLVDAATAEATRLLRAGACFPPGADGKGAGTFCRPLAARDGLVLVQGMVDLGPEEKLCVYRPPPAVAKPCHRAKVVAGEHQAVSHDVAVEILECCNRYLMVLQ
jgi:hypothetical protein